MHSIPLAGKHICFVVITKNLRLTIFLISLGNSSRSSHSFNIKVSKFCRSQMESGNFFIFLFPYKLRYLKCFKVLIELHNVSNVEFLRFSNRRCLNLEMHVSTKDSLILIEPKPPLPSNEKLIVRMLLLNLCKKVIVASTPNL
ncbi:hypothetical protein ACB098_09G167200 [Castanea mollissima]